jgi:hypothetical protein
VVRDFHFTVSKRHGFKFMDKAWQRAFRYAYTKWLEHIRALGLTYDEFCVQVWDEATGGDVQYVVEGGKLLRELDPKVRLVMDGAQSVEEVRRMNPVIDVWIPHLNSLENPKTGKALLAEYKRLGEPVYTYTCSTFMKALSPYTYYRLKPWQAARLGLDGVFYWDYSSWRGDPWDDFDGPIADCGAVYDSTTGPITSRRWEASREGIEDWQLMRLMERLAAQDPMAKPVVRRLIDESLDAVLTQKHRHELADAYRLRLIKAAVELAQSDPLEARDVTEATKDLALNVVFKTNRPTSGTLLHRIVGSNVWESTSLKKGTAHAAAVALPKFAKADWVAVLWDDLGRVTSVRSQSLQDR